MSILRLVGRYEFVKLVGKGGFGVVEEYRDLITNEVVAIKTIPARFVNQESKRLVREIDTMTFLYDAHPHVIGFFSMFVTACAAVDNSTLASDAAQHDGLVVSAEPPPNLDVLGPQYATLSYGAALVKHHNELVALVDKLRGCDEFNLHIVMPLMKGDLLYFIRHTSPSSSRLALTDEFIERVAAVFAFQICFGLDYLHKCNIVHRDIKPENILVRLHNTNPYESIALVADLGLARDAQASDTFYVCTRYYRPPEIITNVSRGETSIDVWSLGCIFFEMVTGRPLFTVGSALNEHGVWEGHRASTQLEVILNIIGTPSHDDIRRFMPIGNAHSYLLRSAFRPSRLVEMLQNNWRMRTTPDRQMMWIELISSCVAFFPEQRPTCEDLCRHQLFRDLNVFYGENVKQHPVRTYHPTPVGTLVAENKQTMLRLVKSALRHSSPYLEESSTDETTSVEEQEEMLFPCQEDDIARDGKQLQSTADMNAAEACCTPSSENSSLFAVGTNEGILPPFPNINDPKLCQQYASLVSAGGTLEDVILNLLNDLHYYTHDSKKSEQLRVLLNYFASLR